MFKTWGVFQVSMKHCELGIGQPSLAHHRYQMVDYLPTMYMYEGHMVSKKPNETVSLYKRTLDTYTWMFTFGSMAAVFITMVVIQNTWSLTMGQANPRGYLFQGDFFTLLILIHLTNIVEESNWQIADFFLSTVFIPKRRLKRWIQRQGFGARKLQCGPHVRSAVLTKKN